MFAISLCSIAALLSNYPNPNSNKRICKEEYPLHLTCAEVKTRDARYSPDNDFGDRAFNLIKKEMTNKGYSTIGLYRSPDGTRWDNATSGPFYGIYSAGHKNVKQPGRSITGSQLVQ